LKQKFIIAINVAAKILRKMEQMHVETHNTIAKPVVPMEY